jgi:hypothetical protein
MLANKANTPLKGCSRCAAMTSLLTQSKHTVLMAVYWLDLGMTGFFASVALGFVVYAALLVWAVARVKEPSTAVAATA